MTHRKTTVVEELLFSLIGEKGALDTERNTEFLGYIFITFFSDISH